MTGSRFKRGDRIKVPYGARTHDAAVTDVRDGRVYVVIDTDSDSPVETFYREAELIPPQVAVFRMREADDPIWRFHSLPTFVLPRVIRGGSDSFDVAHERYLKQLSAALGASVADLPPVKIFIERETSLGSGVWIRTGHNLKNGEELFRAIARAYESMPKALQKWAKESIAASGDTVIIPVRPKDPLRTVLEQITPHDSVILVTLAHDPMSEQRALMWQPVEGNSAPKPVSGEKAVGFGDVGLTLDSSVEDVFRVGLARGARNQRPKPVALPATA